MAMTTPFQRAGVTREIIPLLPADQPAERKKERKKATDVDQELDDDGSATRVIAFYRRRALPP